MLAGLKDENIPEYKIFSKQIRLSNCYRILNKHTYEKSWNNRIRSSS